MQFLPPQSSRERSACALFLTLTARLARAPRLLRNWRVMRVVGRSSLFDREWYLRQNPDVAASGAEPVRHYFSHGAREGRDPHPAFSSYYYLSQNPDVAAAGVNPLAHYLRYGRREGRLPIRPNNGVDRPPEVVLDPLPVVPAISARLHPKFPLAGYLAVHPDLDRNCAVSVDASVSVVIPTYNAGAEFYWLLRKLLAQKGIRQLEIVVVDSGSSDGTAEIARELGAKVVTIPKSEFSHGSARNLGADHATGDLLLFTVQDAFPVGDHWIAGLAACLLDDRAGKPLSALSCAEYPRTDSELLYNALIDTHYRFLHSRHADRVGQLGGSDHYSLRIEGQLSDVACLIRRALFEQYRHQSDYAEDLILGVRLIRDGHRIAMLSSIKVIHSHNRPEEYYLRRTFVDVIFLADVFADFQTPATTSAAATISMAATLRKVVGGLLRQQHGDKPGKILDQAIDAIRAAPIPASILAPSDGGSFGVATFQPWINRTFERRGQRSASLHAIEQRDAGQMRDAFVGRLEWLKAYIGSTYTILDERLSDELMEAVLKILAMTLGAQLAFLSLTARSALVDDNDLIPELKSILSTGI